MLLLVFAAGVGVETIEYDGGTYTGELVDGVPQGQGTWATSAGRKYVSGGTGYRLWSGKVTDKDGDVYIFSEGVVN